MTDKPKMLRQVKQFVNILTAFKVLNLTTIGSFPNVPSSVNKIINLVIS